DELRQDLESFGKQHGIKIRNSMMMKIEPNLQSNSQLQDSVEPLNQIEEKSVKAAPGGSRTLSPNLNQERKFEFETVQTSSPLLDKKAGSSSGPSTEQIKLLIGAAAVIFLIVVTVLISIPLYYAVQNASKPKENVKPITVISVPVKRKTIPVVEPNTSPKTIDSIPSQKHDTEIQEQNSAPLNQVVPATKPDSEVKSNDSTPPATTDAHPHQVLAKKIKVLKKQNRSVSGNSPKPADDDSDLERVYLKKHRGDETQQWMKIQQKMQGE
ncbi:MAG: hypothetical protein K2X81_23450, partial [Candidatus Obscuribacterales bacterium]|nr:hypothetical protein [Candidatus Obscuribacterales bacterium]